MSKQRQYRVGNGDEVALFRAAASKYHPDLKEHGVKWRILAIDCDEADVYPVKVHGWPVLAKIKIVDWRMGLLGKLHVLIELDARRFGDRDRADRMAFADRLLTHIQLGDPPVDEDNNPRITFRKTDWQTSGFREVVERHGMDAIEAQQLEVVNQNVFEFMRESLTTVVETFQASPKPGGDTVEVVTHHHRTAPGTTTNETVSTATGKPVPAPPPPPENETTTKGAPPPRRQTGRVGRRGPRHPND